MNMKRYLSSFQAPHSLCARHLLLLLCAALIVGTLSARLYAAEEPVAPRYNVLFIAIDDLNASLG
jgi:hypothetical protein